LILAGEKDVKMTTFATEAEIGAAIGQDEDITEEMRAEEQRLAETDVYDPEAEQRAAKSASAIKKLSRADRVARLEELIGKAAAYSFFLSQKLGAREDAESSKVAENGRGGGKKRDAPAGCSTGSDRKRRRGAGKENGASDSGEAEDTAVKSGSRDSKHDELLREAERNEGSEPTAGLRQSSLIAEGLELRSYQLEGVQWMQRLYENGLHGILADEMGLGKTIQTIGLFAHMRELGVRGPLLVVAPLSTLANWTRELRKWAPSLNARLYHGTQAERAEMRNALGLVRGRDKALRQNQPIVVTSYEVIMNDRKHLQHIDWTYIVVDEGHRIKNLNCRLIRELKQYRSANRLLLTGTPLQNNLSELWSLLNFLLPDIFDDLDAFQGWFDFAETAAGTAAANAVMTEDQHARVIEKLHLVLRPFLLRRLKEDVAAELKGKVEVVVYAERTEMQMSLYRMIQERTLNDALKASKRARGASHTALSNVFMQLRKCCNHPFLFDEPTDADGNVVTDETIVEASGKMQLLDKLLRRLRAERAAGHKVLIFSQFTRTLDIIEDYLVYRENVFGQEVAPSTVGGRRRILGSSDARESAVNEDAEEPQYAYCRLDGSTKQADRQRFMDEFNAVGYTEMRVIPGRIRCRADQTFRDARGDPIRPTKEEQKRCRRAKKRKKKGQAHYEGEVVDVLVEARGGWYTARVTRVNEVKLPSRGPVGSARPLAFTYDVQFEDGAASPFHGDKFVFLLSTRAGGLGINLIAADTVIIFDSDWNPHQDSQAQDRCHRIGQQRQVVVYRLATKDTVEVKILEKANAKRKLERLVVRKGAFKTGSKRAKLGREELMQMVQDDVDLEHARSTNARAGQGISDAELDLILDRESLAKVNAESEAVRAQAPPIKGEGYEIVFNKASSIIRTVR
jgi:ATP-dependent DNA helicase